MAKLLNKEKNGNDTIVWFEIGEKEKTIKLDNLLTILNIKDFDLEKVKVISITENNEKEDIQYGALKVNELYVLGFRNVDDIKEFKVKGKIKGAQLSILFNFAENKIRFKYNEETNEVKKIIKILTEKI